MSELPGGRVTFLFKDIEGSTRLVQELGSDHYGQLLAPHSGLLRDAATAHGGQEFGNEAAGSSQAPHTTLLATLDLTAYCPKGASAMSRLRGSVASNSSTGSYRSLRCARRRRMWMACLCKSKGKRAIRPDAA